MRLLGLGLKWLFWRTLNVRSQQNLLAEMFSVFVFPCNFGMRSERKQISICFICKKKEKKDPFLWFRYAALAASCSFSLFGLSLSIQVASADDRGIKSLLGRGEEQGSRRGERGSERGSERHSLNISPTPTRHASQPAVCSPLSFLFYQHRKKKKINSYFHNPHSCLSTCLCVSLSSIPLFLSPPLPLPWGRLTPPPRTYGLQMSLRWATITA